MSCQTARTIRLVGDVRKLAPEFRALTDAEVGAYAVLSVFRLDSRIRRFLLEQDPDALALVERALADIGAEANCRCRREEVDTQHAETR